MKLPFREYHILEILKSYDLQNIPLDNFLNNYFRRNKSIGSKDRQFIADSIFDIIRWMVLLDYLSEPSWEKRVEIFKKINPQDYLTNLDIPLHVRVSFPKIFFDKLVEQYGEKIAKDISLTSNTKAPLTIRANLLKTTRNDLFCKLKKNYKVSLCGVSSTAITFQERINITNICEFKEGLFEIQDEGSQLIASLVNVCPSDKVLDFCAGSGGKTLAFCHKMQNKGQIFLHDIRKTPLLKAKIRLKRAGVQNCQIVSSEKHLQVLKNNMDWILLDVPCSGSGTLRRNPDMKWKFSEDTLKNLIQTQKSIFENALQFLKPKGKIVYATCSIFQEENEKQIDYFIKKYNMELIEKFVSFLPEKDKTDGFFGAVLRKKNNT